MLFLHKVPCESAALTRGETWVKSFSRLEAICSVRNPGGTAMDTISVIPNFSMKDRIS